MTGLKLQDGDYVAGGGMLRQVSGREALLQEVLFRLSARRERFPFLSGLGSRLWQLSRMPPAQRKSAAEAFVAEALADEPVQVESVETEEGEAGVIRMTARLLYRGEALAVTLNIQ